MRLPEVHWCYAPPSGPEVGPLPARRAGQVTFGSFNNLAKVTEADDRPVVADPEGPARVPDGRGDRGGQRGGRARAGGVCAARDRQGARDAGGAATCDAYFRLYQGVDICLDTYPFTGCNTTADALWMGVPVVSLAGPSCVTRQGVAALVQVGLGDLVTETPAAYVEAATRLAQDLPRLRGAAFAVAGPAGAFAWATCGVLRGISKRPIEPCGSGFVAVSGEHRAPDKCPTQRANAMASGRKPHTIVSNQRRADTMASCRNSHAVTGKRFAQKDCAQFAAGARGLDWLHFTPP